MDYEQFDAEYRRVLEAAGAGENSAALAAEIVRLRALAGTLADAADRRDAGDRITTIEDVLSYDSESLSAAMGEAIRVLGVAGADEGTPAERVRRARAGMDEIARISAGADRDEQAAILEMNESLAMLIDALESDSR
jgi:hypothetical protein